MLSKSNIISILELGIVVMLLVLSQIQDDKYVLPKILITIIVAIGLYKIEEFRG